MVRSFAIKLALLASALTAPVAANALVQQFAFSSSFSDQGRETASVDGPATLSQQFPATAQFQVTTTDYTLATPGTTIISSGSGIILSKTTNGVTNTVQFRSFYTDATINTVYGNVFVNGAATAGFRPLFTFTSSIFNQPINQFVTGLRYTQLTADTLNSTFGLSNGNNVRAGGDAGQYSLVPEPAALAIFGLGLGLVGLARRRAA